MITTNPPRLEVADILQAHGDAYQARHPVSSEQAAVLRRLCACRTAALGGHVDTCAACGTVRISYNSCRDRHCPKCQATRQHASVEARLERLLSVPYFHVVITLPERLQPLGLKNRRVLYGLLFRAASQTLLQLAADPRRLGAQIGFTAVLHTWGQNLLFHPHLHCVVTGGVSSDGQRWIAGREDYFLPVRVVGQLFRGKFLAGLKAAYAAGQLTLTGSVEALRARAEYAEGFAPLSHQQTCLRAMKTSFLLHPLNFFLIYLASWMNREQLKVIEYLQAENRVLRELLGRRKLLLNDNQRRRLAVKGKSLGRKLLGEIGTLFTPDTILRWHRQLVAEKWDHSAMRKAVGRPATEQAVVDLVLKLATENPRWGYDSIVGRLANLGHTICANTVKNILKHQGIEPAPDRVKQPRWKEFLAAHWGAIAATDFFTVEVWTKGGLVTFFVLFVIDIASRRVKFAGITTSPGGPWMKQVAKNLTDHVDGFLLGKKYLIMDRDGKFAPEFQTVLKEAGVEPLLLPAKSPNLNAYAERFVRSIREECLDRLIFFGEPMLRETIHSYVEHYHAERNHQGLDNKLIDPVDDIGKCEGEIVCRERLGGMLKYYHRKAA